MTRHRTPQELGDLAEELVPHALQLAGLVRTESAAVVRAHLDATPGNELAGLAIVLAALIDIDQTPEQLLSWITWTWDGIHAA